MAFSRQKNSSVWKTLGNHHSEELGRLKTAVGIVLVLEEEWKKAFMIRGGGGGMRDGGEEGSQRLALGGEKIRQKKARCWQQLARKHVFKPSISVSIKVC